MLTSYYPEMGEKEATGTQIEATLSHYGRHWFLKATPGVELKGRGVEFLGVPTAERLVPGSRYVGWGEYKVTDAAFKKVCGQYNVSSASLL